MTVALPRPQMTTTKACRKRLKLMITKRKMMKEERRKVKKKMMMLRMRVRRSKLKKSQVRNSLRSIVKKSLCKVP